VKDSSLYTEICPLSETIAMRRVWQSVILLAFQDAMCSSGKGARAIDRERAIKWLLTNKADFHEVCQNAGYNPLTIRHHAFHLLQSQ
jgi:hypothetical protein